MVDGFDLIFSGLSLLEGVLLGAEADLEVTGGYERNGLGEEDDLHGVVTAHAGVAVLPVDAGVVGLDNVKIAIGRGSIPEHR